MSSPPKGPPTKPPARPVTEVIHSGHAVNPEQKLAAAQAAQKPRAQQAQTVAVTQAAPKPPAAPAAPTPPAAKAAPKPPAAPAAPNPPAAKAAPKPPTAPAAPPPPAAKAAPKPSAAPGAPAKDQIRAVAGTMVDTIFDNLSNEAQRRGGQLSVTDIQGLREDFSKHAQELSAELDESFEAYADAKRTTALHKARRMHLERLMATRFAHLLADQESDLDKSPEKLSRRVIPAFNLTLSVFMGPDAYERMQDRAHEIIEKLQGDGSTNFNWNSIHDAPETPELVLDTLMVIAGNFRDTDRRVKWFTDYIDGHMKPPASPGADDKKAETDAAAEGGYWRFDEAAARKLLKSLFSMLWGVLGDKESRKHLIKRHGVEKVAAAARVVNVFS